MPAEVDGLLLLDTSAAVPYCVADHEHHAGTVRQLRGRPMGLAGHAAFETYSVLTRLPAPVRVTPTSAVRLLNHNFPHSRFLEADAAASLLDRLAQQGVSGGAVYDALVAAVAAQHETTLVTRDARALDTYRAAAVTVQLLH